MTRRRPKVLVAIEPPLLADLVGRALRRGRCRRRHPARTTVAGSAAGMSPSFLRGGGDGCAPVTVVQIADRRAPDFCSLVALVRRLCSVT